MTEVCLSLTKLHASYQQDHTCAVSARKKLRTACHLKIQRQPFYRPILHHGVNGVVNVLFSIVRSIVENSLTVL